MALESATYINTLIDTNPSGADSISQGDDHIRLIKKVLKNTFPSVSSVTAPVLGTTHATTSSSNRPAVNDTYENTGMSVTHTKVSSTSTLYIHFSCYTNMSADWSGAGPISGGVARISGYLGGGGSNPATMITGTASSTMVMFEDIVGTSGTWDVADYFTNTYKVTAANCPDGTSGSNTFQFVNKLSDRAAMTQVLAATWLVWEVEA